jgi:putative phosphoribosyl transferase
MHKRFLNREEAGRELSQHLLSYGGCPDLLVLALPRGGVPVADPVARALGAPLDLLIVRKLGVPGQEELAFGALASGGTRVLNDDIVAACRITSETIDCIAAREGLELERREELYRGTRPSPDPRGKVIILVDDGLATGATMRAAVTMLLDQQPQRIVIAVPVAARETCREFERLDPRVSTICLISPPDFQAVGLWYDDFPQITDQEVIRRLAHYHHQR